MILRDMGQPRQWSLRAPSCYSHVPEAVAYSTQRIVATVIQKDSTINTVAAAKQHETTDIIKESVLPMCTRGLEKLSAI